MDNLQTKIQFNWYISAIFETMGQYFYVYALDTNSVIVAPMIASYSIVSVMNVPNTMEANLVISKLEANGILATKGYLSSGAYLHIVTGFNYQGTDIYVPKLQLNEALEIINEDQNSYFEDLTTLEGKEFLEFGNKTKGLPSNKIASEHSTKDLLNQLVDQEITIKGENLNNNDDEMIKAINLKYNKTNPVTGSDVFLIESLILIEGRKTSTAKVDYIIILGARLYGKIPSPSLNSVLLSE